MKYALKIRKTDLELLAMLNGGVKPSIEKKPTYLIVDTDPEGYNEIVSEKELFKKYEPNLQSQLLMKVKNM